MDIYYIPTGFRINGDSIPSINIWFLTELSQRDKIFEAIVINFF
jgi:hypothetical protein